MSQRYVEMWRDLGISLEKHDELLKVLGEYYKAVYLSQKNRPEKMAYFDFVVSEVHGLRIEELVKLKSEGKKIIGTFCLYVPEELVYAADATSIGLCGGAQFTIPDAEAILPRNLCPLIKSFFGFKVSGVCPYFQVSDLLVGETTCDGKKKVYEVLEDYAPTYVMEVPHKPDTPQARNLWLEEIREFKDKLEELTGNRITVEGLRKAIDLVNEKRKALRRLYELRKGSPPPISGLDALLVTQILFYDDINRYIERVNQLCDELDERVSKGIGVAEEEAPRIMVSGCPMAIPNWKLHSVVESAGAPIVVEESCVGTRYFDDLVEPKGESMEDLLEALYDKYSKIPCACFTPNEERIERIVELAKEFKTDGVIEYILQFCHTYNVEAIKVEKALQETGVPMLKIETDYGMEDVEQIRTRVEALLEMIKSKE